MRRKEPDIRGAVTMALFAAAMVVLAIALFENWVGQKSRGLEIFYGTLLLVAVVLALSFVRDQVQLARRAPTLDESNREDTETRTATGRFSSDEGSMRRALVTGLVVGSVARITLFEEGGTVGAWASVLLVWLCLAGWVIVSFKEDFLERPAGDRVALVRGVLVLLFAAVLVARIFIDEGPVREWAPTVFTLCVLGLTGLAVRRWWATRGA